MDNNNEMFADLETFDGTEVFRQMQEKQKEEESKMLNDEPTMPAAEAVPAVQEEKKAGRGRKRKEETVSQAQKQIHISIPLAYAVMLQSLYSLPGLSIKKGLRDAIVSYIQEQYKKNKKQLNEILNSTQD